MPENKPSLDPFFNGVNVQPDQYVNGQHVIALRHTSFPDQEWYGRDPDKQCALAKAVIALCRDTHYFQYGGP